VADETSRTDWELEQSDPHLKRLRGVERAIEELIVEVDVGLKRSLSVQQGYFATQTRYQRIIAITVVAAAIMHLLLLTTHVIRSW
jgi:hypothetical protein